MLFRREHLEGIRKGSVSLAFRRWRRPSVRSGSTLLTSAGQIEIRSVRKVGSERISREDALRAGYSSTEALWEDLNRRAEGEVYRIELGALLPDPRIALREKGDLSHPEVADLLTRLKRIDRRSVSGPWAIAAFAHVSDLRIRPVEGALLHRCCRTAVYHRAPIILQTFSFRSIKSR